MKKRKRDIAIFVLIIGILAGLLGHQVYLWMRHHLDELDEEIAAQEQLLEAAQTEMQANSIYASKWDELSGFLDEQPEERKTSFTEYLQGLAAEREFVFTDLGPGDSRIIEENPKFQILQYELSYSVELAKLVDFVMGLDVSGELMRIERLNIKAKPVTAYSNWLDRNIVGESLDVLTVKMSVATVASQPESTTDSDSDLPLLNGTLR